MTNPFAKLFRGNEAASPPEMEGPPPQADAKVAPAPLVMWLESVEYDGRRRLFLEPGAPLPREGDPILIDGVHHVCHQVEWRFADGTAHVIVYVYEFAFRRPTVIRLELTRDKNLKWTVKAEGPWAGTRVSSSECRSIHGIVMDKLGTLADLAQMSGSRVGWQRVERGATPPPPSPLVVGDAPDEASEN